MTNDMMIASGDWVERRSDGMRGKVEDVNYGGISVRWGDGELSTYRFDEMDAKIIVVKVLDGGDSA